MGAISRPVTPELSLARLWQFPLLFTSITLFLLGLIRLIPAVPKSHPLDAIASVRGLLAVGASAPAYQEAERLLEDADRNKPDRLALNRLAAEAVWQLESGMMRHLSENAARIVAHYKQAVALGARLEGTELLRVAAADEWLARPSQAASALREALTRGVANAAAVRCKLVALLESSSPGETAEIQKLIDGVIADARAEPENLHWALERRLAGLIDDGRVKEAEEIIGSARPRLAGSPFKQDLLYHEARCRLRAGNPEQADRLLRELRNGWGPKDDLWARAGLLLASVQQSQDRPEAALSLYDEIQTIFPSGAHFAEGLLGRGESLIALERYGEAAETYTRLVEIVERAARATKTGGGPSREALRSGPRRTRPGAASEAGDVDRDVLRARLTTLAEQLRGQGRAEEGLAFTRLAMRLVDSSDAVKRVVYQMLVADLCEQLAQAAARQETAATDAPARDEAAKRRVRLYREAGAALEEVARTELTNESESSSAAWRATEDYAAAGDLETAARLLESFTRERLADSKRPVGLERLGMIREGQGAYRAASEAFDELMREYPLTPQGLHAVVRLAECLASLGGPSRARAEKLLLSTVEQSPQREALFDPRAPEFAEALFKLAELYGVDGRYEDAIYRLETLAALPAAPGVAPGRVRYLLADAYRRSGRALLAELSRTTNVELRERITHEGRARLSHAADLYAACIDKSLVGEERLAALEQAQLRSAWLSRADCLFDLGRYAEARDVYTEAAWRFDGEYSGLTALLGAAHCARRMGQREEARAVLARMEVLCRRMPTEAFSREAGAASKEEWQHRVKGLVAAVGP